MAKPNKKNVCIRMNQQIISLIDETAKKNKIKKVKIIENAIEQYVKKIGGI